ncbi:MAG: hypothetical protein HY319_10190 [Armatimonadetes bacterium]|nr:hypothetical protein [Armatimonadota bacterium]
MEDGTDGVSARLVSSFRKPATAAEAVHQIARALELAGHLEAAQDMQQLLARLLRGDLSAGNDILDRCHIRYLGDLYVGFLEMDWLELLGRAATLTRSEMKAGRFRAAALDPPELELTRLLESSGASRSDCVCALTLAGPDVEKARRLLQASRAVPTPWESVVAPCYSLRLSRSRAAQKPSDRSFLGGLPTLPPARPLPVCRRCSQLQTFFFQVELPPDNPWAGSLFSVFACTSCAPPEALIPGGAVRTDVDLEKGAGDNFELLRSPVREVVPREDYPPRVQFRRFELVPADPESRYTKIGGSPRWVMEREYSPGPDGFLLCQFQGNRRLKIDPEAPAQAAPFGLPPRQEYELWVGNEIYFFASLSQPVVTILVQKP